MVGSMAIPLLWEHNAWTSCHCFTSILRQSYEDDFDHGATSEAMGREFNEREAASLVGWRLLYKPPDFETELSFQSGDDFEDHGGE